MLRRSSFVVAGLALLVACGELPITEPPQVVTAIFDPSRAEVPSPNDLAMVDGVVQISPNDAAHAADNELKALFNGKDGFSAGTSTRVRFSGAMSAATFSADSVVVLDLGREGESAAPSVTTVRYEYAECDHSLTLSSSAGWQPGHTYLFAVRGGEKASADEADTFRVKGVQGEPLVPSPAFHFLKAGKDLREHPYAFPGTREERKASATALEGVRQKYEPLFQVLEEHGLPRRDLAILWTVTIQTSGEASFDPASKKIPMPNDLLRDPSSGKVTLPIDPAESEAAQALKRGFNQLDGFSTTAALTLQLTTAVHRDGVKAGETVRLFERDTLVEKTDIDVGVSEDGKQLSIQPKSPLRPDTHYVVVVGGISDAAQEPISAMPLANLLKLQSPLLVEGRSQISSLCAEQVERLEPMRAAMQPVLDSVAATLPREELAAAWTFKTQDILGRLQALYATPYEKNLPLEVTDVDNRSPWDRGLPLFNVARVITGKMTTYDHLDPVTRAFRENGAGVNREIEFVLTLPKDLKENDKVPVVVFGHGLMTERRLVLFLADKLADEGFAAMAIDLPLHGERTACTLDSHCESGATCATDGVCVKNGKRADFARLPAPAGWGNGTPTATGQAFVDVENLSGSRDHFRQAIIDLSAQTRLIQKMDWRPVTGGFHLDGGNVYYAGISLGGILGGNLSASDPVFKAMLLNVGGAGIVDLMQESTTFGPVLRSGLAEKGIEEGTPAFSAFVNAARWVLDEIDPINLAVYGAHSPRSYVHPETGETLTAPKKRLRLHMAQGDTVVPNASTLRLLEATRLSKDAHFRSFIGSHGFLANPSEVIPYVQGQQDMVDFFRGDK